MKRSGIGLAVLCALIALWGMQRTDAASILPRGADIRLAGRLNCPWISTEGGRVYLQLSIRAQEVPHPDRMPMNLAVVLDRSGSMGSEGKIENARAAVRGLIDQLRSDDILSIVIYDDVVEVLRPAARVGDKAILRRLVDEIYPRGWTNLCGGMTEGFRQVEACCGRGYVNRVILLSDGLANRGITSQEELTHVAQRYRSRSVSLSTIGVGLEYNENLMVSLASGGGGNYYYLERAKDLASIFRKEFDLLSTLVAQNASIEVSLARGVHFRDAIGCESLREEDRATIALGDLASGECRDVTLELDVPPGAGNRTVAECVVRYSTEGNATKSSNTIAVRIHYTGDVAVIDKNRDWDTQAKADVAVSTRKVEQALQALDAGHKDEALHVLNDARAAVAASPAAAQSGMAGAVLKQQEIKLRGFTETLNAPGAVSKAKKSIQYENYRVQRNR
jgi:Ca-activated chloride channel family protein